MTSGAFQKSERQGGFFSRGFSVSNPAVKRQEEIKTISFSHKKYLHRVLERLNFAVSDFGCGFIL